MTDPKQTAREMALDFISALDMFLVNNSLPPTISHGLADLVIKELNLEKLIQDSERLDWLESKHTLHNGVDILYVVDGYTIQDTYDSNPNGLIYHGETLRQAIDNAIKETKE